MELIAALQAVVGEDYAVDRLDLAWKEKFVRALVPGKSIAAMVFPGTQQELANVLQLAHQHQWEVIPCGNGSKLSWGNLAGGTRPAIAVSTSRLHRLVEHAAGDLTVTVEAGMKLADLQASLAAAGQFLAIDPAYPEAATIGGIVATGDTGSLRHRYNSVRDQCIGIAFVRADGELVKAGGRVVKNVAGYDLMKLLTGSWGTLGAIAQLTFRLYPLPEASQTVVLLGEPDAIAIARTGILMSPLSPALMDLVSPQLVAQMQPGNSSTSKRMALVLRFDSIPEGVKEQCRRLQDLAAAWNLQAIVAEEGVFENLREQLRHGAGDTMLCKLGILPTAIAATLADLTDLLPDARIQMHAASGLGMLRTTAIDAAMLTEIRRIVTAKGGFATLLEAPVAVKQTVDAWGDMGNARQTMEALRRQFDPSGRLNPGRF